jgi:aspartate aminotransferase
MSIDLAPHFKAAESTASRACDPYMDGLRGSDILAIAQQVRTLQLEGRKVFNLTIGDFDPKHFPIPPALTEAIKEELDRGHTNYPPAVGMQELREAIVGLYERDLGISLPLDSVLCGSGARPPLYAVFGVLVGEDDTVIYPVPSWNVNHYTFLNRGKHVPLVTSPEQGFMPTVEQIQPHITTARVILINSPSNPAGTIIGEQQLIDICDLILAENARRLPLGERPLFLVYDAVYWQLCFQGTRHFTPYQVRPEMAPYTVMIDAISKCWAATGLRVGWCTAPPWVRVKMQALIGHMGAWAGKAEQVATARVLADPALTAEWTTWFHGEVEARLAGLERGISELAAGGTPIRCLKAQGAIYLSVQFDIVGRTAPDGTVLANDEAVRSYILQHAGVAVVPFTAFGYPDGSGWVRMSVGAISRDDVAGTLLALQTTLAPFKA